MRIATLSLIALLPLCSQADLMNDNSTWALKSQIFFQSDFGSTTPYSYFFDSGALETGATAAPSVAGGAETETMTGVANNWSYSELFSEQDDMDASFPNGPYSITSNGTPTTAEVAIGVSPTYADAYPDAIPALDSVTGSSFVDGKLSIPFTTSQISFDWNDPGGSVTDVLLTLFDSDYQLIFYGLYDGDAQSTGLIDFPFASAGDYEAELIFMNKTTDQVVDGVDVYGGFYHGTALEIEVVPEQSSYAVLCGLAAFIVLIARRRS
ncbi:hypothetical protein [Cerasicoccus frondis]|uniref:hypothetical protein n=1 Tax=Cerasicoccus frondis TaxID=490090 RepID=UPI00285282C8|nr:hypothetical protein [Cerasicoccus frondis]